jgi:hypothetical protein
MNQAPQMSIDEVAGELLREELRLGEIEDRLRRLELERTAGDVRVIASALSKTREALGMLTQAAV